MKGKIFNAQEVQSILSGNKTMFREICKRQPQGEMEQPYVIRQAGITEFNYPFGKIPYKVGEKIFCKESFFEDLTFRRFAGFEAKENLLEINRRYMKQEHSRLTLQIKEIRVEKLKDISDRDLIKEGYDFHNEGITLSGIFLGKFKNNWNATHKKPEEKFEANPWVWSISFGVLHAR
jgi:hypothetical protein